MPQGDQAHAVCSAETLSLCSAADASSQDLNSVLVHCPVHAGKFELALPLTCAFGLVSMTALPYTHPCSAHRHLILIWILGMLALVFLFPKNAGGIALFLTYVGLAGAVIHSVTWLAAMPQILPFKLDKSRQKTAYAFLLILFLAITLLINWYIFNGLVLLI